MKKNERKKDIATGLLVVAFGFAVILVRMWLFPDNEALRYIALFIGIVLVNNGSRLALNMNEAKPEDLQEEKADQAAPYKPVFWKRWLVLAGIMAACSAGCFWGSHSNILPVFPFAAFGLVFLMLTTFVVMYVAVLLKNEDSDNDS